MKILFPLISAGSGSDIFTKNLVSGLNQESIPADIQILPGWSGFIPPITGNLCNSNGYDIIHSNTWNGFLFACDLPLVVTEHLVVHDPIFSHYKSMSQHIYHKLIYRNEKKSIYEADVVVSVSNYVKDQVEKTFGYSDSKVIYNGVDMDVFKPVQINKDFLYKKYQIPSDKTILFFSGNATIRKGGDMLPKIMRNLGDNYVLLMTGGLRNKETIACENIISFGKVSLSELIHLYNICDIFLFPTRLEGLCLSVLEAMACEKPVITTNISSLPEQIIDGKGGYLCPIDDVSAFADAVQHLADDENLRKTMGNFNRQRVREYFTLDRMTSEYMKVYRNLPVR